LYQTTPEISKGKPANFSINSAIPKVLNDDPTASVRDIAKNQAVRLNGILPLDDSYGRHLSKMPTRAA
jgi:hypothetical protein